MRKITLIAIITLVMSTTVQAAEPGPWERWWADLEWGWNKITSAKIYYWTKDGTLYWEVRSN